MNWCLEPLKASIHSLSTKTGELRRFRGKVRTLRAAPIMRRAFGLEAACIAEQEVTLGVPAALWIRGGNGFLGGAHVS
jgi:hypothetical protein